ncbi:MAG TPA: hypothetical protein VGU02_12885 [Gaiellaceae bacterium]|nr:hypothetical protein [Gaiellaceae bacterium]
MNANDVIILVSIVVPVTLTIVIVWVFLRGWKDDPDEQRWQRLAEQRKRDEAQAAVPRSGPKSSSDE